MAKMSQDTETILAEIKTVWPTFQITKEHLTHTNSELVMKFYTNFLNELEDRLQGWADYYYVSLNAFNIDHLEPEEQVYVRISCLFKSLSYIEFKLCDVFGPTSVRTKSFFHICCHILMFAENIYEDVEKFTTEVIKMKEDIVILLKKREELLSIIDEQATKTSQLMYNLDTLEEKLVTSQNAYEKMKEKKVGQEKIFSRLTKQLEDLKRQFQTEEHEVNNLEHLDKTLSEQVVTEEEYQHLFRTNENLDSELKNLCNDDNDLEDLLVDEKSLDSHYQESLKRIPNDFLTKTINTILESENMLQDIEILNETMSSKIEQLNGLKSQKENNVKGLMEKSENLTKEERCLEKEFGIVKMKHVKRLFEIEKDVEEQNKIMLCIMDYKAKSTKHLKQLQDTFAREYIDLAELDSTIRNHYREQMLNMRKFV